MNWEKIAKNIVGLSFIAIFPIIMYAGFAGLYLLIKPGNKFSNDQHKAKKWSAYACCIVYIIVFLLLFSFSIEKFKSVIEFLIISSSILLVFAILIGCIHSFVLFIQHGKYSITGTITSIESHKEDLNNTMTIEGIYKEFDSDSKETKRVLISCFGNLSKEDYDKADKAKILKQKVYIIGEGRKSRNKIFFFNFPRIELESN